VKEAEKSVAEIQAELSSVKEEADTQQERITQLQEDLQKNKDGLAATKKENGRHLQELKDEKERCTLLTEQVWAFSFFPLTFTLQLKFVLLCC